MKKSTKILLSVLFVVVVIAIVVVSNVVRQHAVVRGIAPVVNYGDSDTLVTAERLQEEVLAGYATLMSKRVRDVDLDSVQRIVCANPYVEKCNVSVSIDCRLVLQVVQRTPVMRLFLGADECYFDMLGRYMPLSDEGEADVLVANEEVAEHLSAKKDSIDLSVLAADSLRAHLGVVQMWQMACYLHRDAELHNLFDQVFFAKSRDLILVPKVGNHKVVVGSLDYLDQKFADLLVFYRQGMPQVGWDTYDWVNLKYEGQVICSEKQ